MCSHTEHFTARNKCLTAKLLKQGYRYRNLWKAFSKFYRRHYEMISKFNVGLKSLLHKGLSEPEFYGDLVYKFKNMMGRTDSSDLCRIIIIRHKRIGYDLNDIRHYACFVINPTMLWLITSLHVLFARWWIERQTLIWPRPKAIHFSW